MPRKKFDRYHEVPPVLATCTECGTEFQITQYYPAYRWKTTGRSYCSLTCKDALMARVRSRPITDAHKAILSARMKEDNPMRDAATRERVSESLRAMGHRPPVRRGNGHGLTEPQRLLAEALGWPTEVVVLTGPRRKGIPTCYKIDVANPDTRIAVEIDGASHCALSRQAADRRKESFLHGEGWTVLRFSNQEVMADTEACARTVLSTTSRWPGPTPTASATA